VRERENDQEGIGVINYYALASGFLSGKYRSEADFGKSKRGGGMAKYLTPRGHAVLGALDVIAAEVSATPAQVALAWLLAQGDDIVPIPGTKRRQYLEQNVAALEVTLDDKEIATLASAFPLGVPAGMRYPDKQKKALGI